MWTPARSWLIILKAEPTPTSAPRPYTLAAIASKIGSARFIASSRPDARSVNAPSAARAGPPLVGASRKVRPVASILAPMLRVSAGSIVTQDMISASGAVDARTPASPNRTDSHCAAFTTTRMTASAPDAASREDPVALPNSSAKRAATEGFASAPTTDRPFRAKFPARP